MNYHQKHIGASYPNDTALSWTSKLIFHIGHRLPSLSHLWNPIISPLISIILTKVFAPESETTSNLLNAILVIDGSSKEWKEYAFPATSPTDLAEALVKSLEAHLTTGSENTYEAKVTPVISQIRFLLGTPAPDSITKYLQKTLLPGERERDNILGTTSSLPDRILRLTTKPGITSSTVSAFLFELSDKDANQLIQNIGFGYASGILFNLGIPLPAGADMSGVDQAGEQINPVTGQKLDKEIDPTKELQEMTEEEKEQEAERLFVLFKRLEETGVMKVENNPIRQAVQSGRFEELPDDYEDDANDGEGSSSKKK
jgi:hypothetical protein